MAFSGTVSTTTFTTRRVIEHACRRCGVAPQQITAESIDVAKDALWLMLSNWGNSGPQLWTIEKQIYGLYEGVSALTLDIGTIDVLNSNLRLLQEATGTNTTTSTTYTYSFGSDTAVTTVGVLWSAAAVPLAIEQSIDGSAWATIQTETPTAVAGEWSWFDLNMAVATPYLRIRATTGTLSFSQIFAGNTPSEIPLARLNRDDYTNLPNKTFQSNRPLQYWFDRQVKQPIMHLWPVPNAAAETQQIVVWRQRHIMDVGSLTQEIEVPQRWYEALVAGLAAKLVYELPDADTARAGMLDDKADKALYTAQQEERDNSPIRIAPNISPYTR